MIDNSKDFIGASLIPLVLIILTESENYGYELIQQLKNRSDAKLNIAEGTLYPMLKKMAELNDRFLFGKASISGPNGDVYYCSSFWLKNADKDVVGTEVALAHINRLLLKKELEPFTKNE